MQEKEGVRHVWYIYEERRARGMTCACPWPPINSPPSGCLTYVLYAHLLYLHLYVTCEIQYNPSSRFRDVRDKLVTVRVGGLKFDSSSDLANVIRVVTLLHDILPPHVLAANISRHPPSSRPPKRP